MRAACVQIEANTIVSEIWHLCASDAAQLQLQLAASAHLGPIDVFMTLHSDLAARM